MGVPKFYRWISERYPCLSQVIKEYQIPEFDNMYLDMNGIIHPCSHPNDEDAHFRITEQEIFQNIFNYIECVFRLIKPKKIFFMAVDGVAPRAKMNQQRARRFRSAMDAETLRKEALAKGEVLPSEDKFDSNCITPGTEFMCKLHEQLKYFVNKKMSSDPAWQSVKIILSGHNVPGEGEHKIMEYIRYMKQQPDYDPNTRHCLYGLDADLMFLGLATHELHFSLLREEVKFGKTQKRISAAEEQCFHLLHLSLFREYVDKEFSCLKVALGEEYDLERIIDDFILLSFLVGNDFIPHLPEFHIQSGSLPSLWQTYKEVRPTLNGYLHQNGDIIMPHMAAYLQTLSGMDYEKFEMQYDDLKWMAGKAEERRNKEQKQSETDRLKDKFGAMMMIDSDEEEVEDEEEEVDMLQTEFTFYKKKYYMDKFGLAKNAVPPFITEIGFKYIEGLQWILRYYFQGVPSWSWYYPYHYAPYLSDLTNVTDIKISLDLSEPFTPFQQLMAVLPPGSAKLLPTVLQELYKPTSDIVDYYPPEFSTDLNGKKQEWEAVVLIPFIDETRLVGAMATPLDRLTDDEKSRNSHGPCIEGAYDPENKAPYPSSLPGVFPELRPCYTSMLFKDKHCYRIGPEELTYTFPDPAVDPFTRGFPTLRHLKHTSEFEVAGCKIFSFASKDPNCILNMDPQAETPIEEYTALIGECVYVDYPHNVESLVVGVLTEEHDYFLDDNCVVKKPAVSGKKDCFKHIKSRECITLRGRSGIEVGDVRAIVCVRKIRGKVPTFSSSGEVSIANHWCEEKANVPAQLVISNLRAPIPVQEKLLNLSLATVFPEDAKVFVVSNPGYGSMGRVDEVIDNKVKVRLTLDDEPLLQELRGVISRGDEDWYFPREVSSEVGISPFMLSKITSAFKIAVANKNGKGTSPFNIGLNVKYSNKRLISPEYARKIENGGFQYSKALIEILKGYVGKYPELFRELDNHLKKDIINASDIAGKFGPDFNVREYLEGVKKYLKTLPVHGSKLIGLNSEMITAKHVPELLKQLKEHKSSLSVHEMVVKVKPRVLFNPTFQNGILPPDADADFSLLDRVVNVCASHCVPFGYKGTIVGIKKSDESTVDNVQYEVLFDEEFIGGGSYGVGCPANLYTMLPFTLLNFSYGKRLCRDKTDPSRHKQTHKQTHRNQTYTEKEDQREPPPQPRRIQQRSGDSRPSDRGRGVHQSGSPPRRGVQQESPPRRGVQQESPPRRGVQQGSPPRRGTRGKQMSDESGYSNRQQEWVPGPPPRSAPPPAPAAGGYPGYYHPYHPPLSPVSPIYPPAPHIPGIPPQPSPYTYMLPPYNPSQWGYIPQYHHPPYPMTPHYPGYYQPGYQALSHNLQHGQQQHGQQQHRQQQHFSKSQGRKKRNERRNKEAEYEGQFYHGQFYEGNTHSEETDDPYLNQPGKSPKSPSKSHNVSPGGTHYYDS